MSQTESWTVGRLLTWTADYLKQHGSESGRLDAEILLAEARQCDRVSLYTAFNDPVDEKTRGRFRELVRRRATGEPVAYLIGRREFYSMSLAVTPDVLIPRPETEHLVVAALDCIGQLYGDQQPVEVADVGTGSGAIAAAIATHAKTCQVTAIDISPAALQVAQSNVDALELNDRVTTVQSDLFAALPAEQRFDVIVSNPPYVSQLEWESLATDVKAHEPQLALVGGASGTEIIQRLVPQAAQRLTIGGWLLIEISPTIATAVQEIIIADGNFDAPELTKDLSQRVRIVAAKRIAGISNESPSSGNL